MNGIKLSDCTLITGAEYMKLEDPEFMGQTRMNAECQYYMVWKCEGVLYKTFNTL